MKMFYVILIVAFNSFLLLKSQQSAVFVPEVSQKPFCKHGIEHLLASSPDIPLVKRPYDVLSMNIFMDWRTPLSAVDSVPNNKRTFKGITSLTVSNNATMLSSIVVDIGSLRIDSLFINNVYQSQSLPPKVGQEQTIPIPNPFQVNQPYTLRFHYTFVGTSNQGFFVYQKNRSVNMDQGVIDTLPAALCYTMSEPIFARDWTPCNDAPYDKFKSSISIRVPEGNLATSNGNQDSTLTHLEDNSLTFFYSDTTPIPTYLMVAVASKFTYWTDTYSRVTDTTIKVPVHYYAWERDVDGTQGRYNAKNAYKYMVKMMEDYSTILGEYPFNSYGMAVIQPFFYGGMEHQTMTTINRAWLLQDFYEGGIAHELMHHWTGDLVSCATWNDLWLNEGGASWGESLWEEAKSGNPFGGNTVMDDARRYYVSKKQVVAPIYGIPVDKLFQYTWITYSKASWIYHMMARHYGKEIFFPALQKYFQKYSYQSVTTEEFKNFFQNELTPNDVTTGVPYPISVNEFMDQWVYNAGHPTYDVNYKTIPKGTDTEVTVTLRQTQQGSGINNIFKAPVQILFSRLVGAEITDTAVVTIYNEYRTQVEKFTLSFEPTNILFDPYVSLLHEVNEITTSISEVTQKNLQMEAFFDQNTLNISNITEGTLSIEIYTVNGERVSKYSSNVFNGNFTGTITNQPLSNGYYLVVARNNGVTTSIPMVMTK